MMKVFLLTTLALCLTHAFRMNQRTFSLSELSEEEQIQKRLDEGLDVQQPAPD